MSRLTIGANPYSRITPIHKSNKTRTITREDNPRYACRELRMTVDVTSKEVKEQERLNRMIDFIGWPFLKVAVFLLIVILIVNFGRYLWSLI